MKRKNIEAERTSFAEALDHKRLMQAPHFQRPYVWTDRQLQTFVSDIDGLVVSSDPEIEHFMGPIVVKDVEFGGGSKPTRLWIIDGQQRLTTMMLAILACDELAPVRPRATSNVSKLILKNAGRHSRSPRMMPTARDMNQLAVAIAQAG
jgi:uncharacterized protein with ParB-like and HNH nuclease domain